MKSLKMGWQRIGTTKILNRQKELLESSVTFADTIVAKIADTKFTFDSPKNNEWFYFTETMNKLFVTEIFIDDPFSLDCLL